VSDRFSKQDERSSSARELSPESTPPTDPVSSLQRVAWRLEQIADTFDQLAEQLRSLAELVME